MQEMREMNQGRGGRKLEWVIKSSPVLEISK
jgi:hypothetical protein